MTEGRISHPSHLRLYTLLILMVLFWALNFLIGKVALREFPPLLLAGLRASLAGLLILPVYAWRKRKRPTRGLWSREEFPTLLFLGFVGVTLNQLFFITGLHRTSVAHSSILMGVTPLFVLLIAARLRLEKMTASKVVGMLIAIGGVVVLTRTPSKASGATLTGDFFILLAAVAFALFAVFGKRATVSHGSVTVNTFAYLGGGLMLSPITVWQAWQFSFSELSLTAWVSLLYMALFPSLICYLIFYYALTFIAASRVSTFGYLQPPIATLLAVILLDEPVTKALVAGGALVLTGVYVTERT